jgi:hypothetical protein
LPPPLEKSGEGAPVPEAILPPGLEESEGDTRAFHAEPRELGKLLLDNSTRPIDLSAAEAERLVEHFDAQSIQRRAGYYVWLRQNEGFSKVELDHLDAFPLRMLERESRKMLAARGRSPAPAEGVDVDGNIEPPGIPVAQGPSPDATLRHESEYQRLLQQTKDITGDPNIRKDAKDRARREFIRNARVKPRSRRAVV